MAKVKIIIKGIAMSYHKNDDLWKVIFPFEGCHQIKFKESLDDLGVPLAQANREISISTINPSSTFEIGSNYNDFLDLTADYSHSAGIRLKQNWQDAAVLMTIENAGFSVDEYTEKDHILLKDKVVALEPTRIGYSGKIEIESEKVVIDVSNHPDFPKTYEEDCVLIFDNDCEQGERRLGSDIDLVYNVVEDTEEPTQQFTVAKVSDDLRSTIIRGTVFNSKDKDPFSDLPCHIVIISNSENLP